MTEHVNQLLQSAFPFFLRHDIAFFRCLVQAPEGDDREYGVKAHQVPVASEDFNQLCGKCRSNCKHQSTYASALCDHIIALLIVQRHSRKDCHLRHGICRYDHPIEHVGNAHVNTFFHRASLDESRVAEQQEHINQQKDRCKCKPGAVPPPSRFYRITDHSHDRVIDGIPQGTDQQNNRQLRGRDSDGLLYIQ